jgi:hypothetical protein
MIGLGHALTLALAPQGAGSSPPPEPQNFRVTGQGSVGLSLAWDELGLAVRVQYQPAAGDWSAPVEAGTTSNPYFEVVALSSDTAYDVRVRTEQGGAVSEWVVLNTVWTGSMALQGLTATGANYGILWVQWTASGSVSLVNIYLDGVLTASGIPFGATSYFLPGLMVGSQYIVTASGVGYNGGKEGSLSAPLQAYAGAGSAPSNSAHPEIYAGAGAPYSNVTFVGSWSGDPDSFSYTYQWLLDNNPIGGTTTDNINFALPGNYICSVTATNAVGSTSEWSNQVTYSP